MFGNPNMNYVPSLVTSHLMYAREIIAIYTHLLQPRPVNQTVREMF